MITFKNLIRMKVTKVYIVIFTVLLTAILSLNSFKIYFINLQDSIFRENSELIVINDKDIYKNLQNVNSIDNVNRVLTFRENREYDLFKGDLIDNQMSSLKESQYLYWFSIERDQLKDYILVESDTDYDFSLNNYEIVLSLNSFWYDSYDKTVFDSLINNKIGFLFNSNNIEFNLKNIISSNTTKLIISNQLYSKLLMEDEKYSYVANLKTFNGQAKLKNDIKNIIKSDDYILSVDTTYKDDMSNKMSDIYDLIDALKLCSIISIIIFVIIMIVLVKNIINDFKTNIGIYRRIGFNKIAIKRLLMRNLTLLYSFITILSTLLFIVVSFIIDYLYSIQIEITMNDYLFIFIMGIIINFILVLFLKLNKTED